MPCFQGQKIKNDTVYYLKNSKDSLQFETLKFYVTNIKFLLKNKIVFTEKNQKNNGAHLIDNSDENSKKISINTLKKITFDAIQFDIGVDSLTNVSGAMGGDLDPTKGMYWAWQSGYINAKIEGKSSLCNNRLNEFQFHLGGYQTGNNALQTVVLSIKKANEMRVFLNIGAFIEKINLAKTNQIMSPSQEAVFISKHLATCFSLD